MIKPVYYNIFACLAISFAALILVILLFRRRIEEPDFIPVLCFWLLVACLWLVVGMRTVFFVMEMYNVDRALFLVAEILTILHLIPAVYYLTYRVFENKNAGNLVSIFYVFLVLVFAYLIIKGDIFGPYLSIWGSEYSISSALFYIFLIAFVPILFLIILDLGKRIIIWVRKRMIVNLDKFFMTLSLLVYAVGGAFDVKGVAVGWGLMFIRMFIMTAILLAFLSVTWKQKIEIKR